ncbi:MAG: hypothetical protein ACREHD_15225 [Pirellulales bacterium]
MTRTVFDARDVPVSIWVGNNNTRATWLGSTRGGAPSNNMVMVKCP